MSKKNPLTTTINLRIDPGEKNLIRRAAAEQGMQASAYIRDAALARAGGLTSEDRANLRRLLGQVGKLGNNVNQMAKLAWQARSVDPEKIERLTAALAALRAQVREAIQ